MVSHDNTSLDGPRIFRSGYVFGLSMLFASGVLLIGLGAALFPQGTFLYTLFVGAGIAAGPAAIIAALFRVFLFQEIQYQLTRPVVEEVKQRIGPEINAIVEDLVDNYRREIRVIQALRDAGILLPHRRRERALRDFATAIDAETSEIKIVGSSLKGLLKLDKSRDIAEKLRFKIQNAKVPVKFLMTHPAVADLRARQEGRRFGEIGTEIIDSLLTLKDWGVKEEHIRLYLGTPTCFAIKTTQSMLLNPYPYGAVSYDSPCLIVQSTEDHPSYFYEEFEKSHFGAWETDVAVRIYSYDDTISTLRSQLKTYEDRVKQLLAV